MARVGRGRVLVSLSLPRSLDRRLELQAARIDRRKSEVAAAALAALLEELERLPPGQAARRVDELLQNVEEVVVNG